MFHPALTGHRGIRERLLARLQEGRLGGSLLFAGPEGIGKRRVAAELAMRELCFRRSACGACEGCRAFLQEPVPDQLPNFLRIAPEGKASLIKVGAIRDSDLVEGGVIAWAFMAPPPGCHRWILVEDAHRLHGASANILLKTLEEPPLGTHFLLVTHRPEAMLPTIRSRCERIAFAPLALEDAWAIAKGAGWEEAEREAWGALSEGSLRFLERESFDRAAAQVEAWLNLAGGASFREASAPLLPEKDADLGVSEQLRQPLELLLLLLKDAARVRAGAEAALGPWEAGIGRLARSAVDLKAPQDSVFLAMRHLARNPAPEPVLREIAMALA